MIRQIIISLITLFDQKSWTAYADSTDSINKAVNKPSFLLLPVQQLARLTACNAVMTSYYSHNGHLNIIKPLLLSNLPKSLRFHLINLRDNWKLLVLCLERVKRLADELKQTEKCPSLNLNLNDHQLMRYELNQRHSEIKF